MQISGEMAEVNSAKKYLASVIIIYLRNLQGGEYGIPTMEDLQNAGNLHAFLEDLNVEEK